MDKISDWLNLLINYSKTDVEEPNRELCKAADLNQILFQEREPAQISIEQHNHLRCQRRKALA